VSRRTAGGTPARVLDASARIRRRSYSSVPLAAVCANQRPRPQGVAGRDATDRSVEDANGGDRRPLEASAGRRWAQRYGGRPDRVRFTQQGSDAAEDDAPSEPATCHEIAEGHLSLLQGGSASDGPHRYPALGRRPDGSSSGTSCRCHSTRGCRGNPAGARPTRRVDSRGAFSPTRTADAGRRTPWPIGQAGRRTLARLPWPSHRFLTPECSS